MKHKFIVLGVSGGTRRVCSFHLTLQVAASYLNNRHFCTEGMSHLQVAERLPEGSQPEGDIYERDGWLYRVLDSAEVDARLRDLAAAGGRRERLRLPGKSGEGSQPPG